MKISYMGIIRTGGGAKTVELVSEKNLAGFSRFTSGNFAEGMTMLAKTVAERTKAGQRQDVEENGYTIHAYGRSEGIAGIVITDQEYPALVAHQVLGKIVDEFLTTSPKSAWATGDRPAVAFPELKGYLDKYQDPQQADSIMKIQQQLDDTKIVLHKTIESVLQRGEKLDDLVAKSEDLSFSTRTYFNQAKKQNSCCQLM